MPVELSNDVWHSCGTCGTIFRSVRELNSHVAVGHSGEHTSSEAELSYPASLRARGTAHAALYAQFTNQPMAR